VEQAKEIAIRADLDNYGVENGKALLSPKSPLMESIP
jgi:hypothetical protein